MRAAVFLDRDGTIIEDVPYLDDAGAVKFLPGAAAAMNKLTAAGFLVIGVSNQSGVARGLVTETKVRQINEHIIAALACHGARLERIYFCPHHPEFSGPCDCRKPSPGMLLEAMADYDLDLGSSYFIGDNVSDTGAGRRAGCVTVRLPGKPGNDFPPLPDGQTADHRADSLTAAADWVLAHRDDTLPPEGKAGTVHTDGI